MRKKNVRLKYVVILFSDRRDQNYIILKKNEIPDSHIYEKGKLSATLFGENILTLPEMSTRRS